MRTFFLFLVLFSFFTIDGNAQKCKTYEDPFSNEKVTMFNWKNKIVFFELKNDNIKFEIKCNYRGERNVTLEKGQKLYFKLENGETLELETCVDAHPDTQISATQYSATVYTSYSFVFCITKNQLEKLANFKMTAFRYPDTNGEYLDIVLKGKRNKYARAVNEGGQCIIGKI